MEESVFYRDEPDELYDNYVGWVLNDENIGIRIKFCPFCGKHLKDEESLLSADKERT